MGGEGVSGVGAAVLLTEVCGVVWGGVVWWGVVWWVCVCVRVCVCVCVSGVCK